MTRYADPSVCPDCRAQLPSDPISCPTCTLPLQGPLAVSLFRTLSEADRLLADLRASTVAVTETVQPTAPTAAHTADTTTEPRPAAGPPRTGVRGSSVATILLGLGALCLLVAAIIFLAVAWSWLGVGGRTAVLVTLTLCAGGVAGWLGRRGLRVAAESLTIVSLGLLTLDVAGADHAGWLGDLSASGFTCVVGGALLLASFALLFLHAELGAPQIAAVIAVCTVASGAQGTTTHDQVVAALAVVASAALAGLGRLRGLRVLPWAALVGAAGWWLSLLWLALWDAIGTGNGHDTAAQLLLHGHRLGLLTAAALLLLPLLFTESTRIRNACLGGAASVATLAIGLPGWDDDPTRFTLVLIVLLALWTGIVATVPAGWRRPAEWPLRLCAVPVGAVSAVLLLTAVDNTADVGNPFTRAADVRLGSVTAFADPWLLVPGVLGLALAAMVVAPTPARRTWPVVVAATALAGIGTLGLYPVPLWTVTTALALASAALVVDALRRADVFGSVEAAVGAAVAAAAIVAALPSAALTAGSTAVLVLEAAAVARRGRFPHAAVASWAVLPVASAGLIWSAAEVAGIDEAYRAAPILLVLAAMAIRRPRPEVEVSAGFAGVVAAVSSVESAADPVTSLAVHLTLAGALVTASALVNPSRRELGWVGGLLLAAATWVRLAEIGVQAPEAYTLPSAVALLLVGLYRLRVDPTASTQRALVPGLLLATIPSLLWVIAGDVVSLRALLLGLGCLGLVLAGVQLRWNAPLVVGSTVGALVVLRELAPYAGHTPQWVVIGLAGTVLTMVGVTWERRMLEIRTAAAYLGRLR